MDVLNTSYLFSGSVVNITSTGGAIFVAVFVLVAVVGVLAVVVVVVMTIIFAYRKGEGCSV